MIKYTIRSIALLNIFNDVKSGRLIPDAYFQRNLVWREVHKKDFIETLLLGYPVPQMFFSRGKIDIEKMSSTSCIVDGQQRTDAIVSYIDNKYSVKDKKFQELTDEEKSNLLKYEIAVVELDLDNDSPHVLEIFKRLNRTSNSLTSIEKLASEYAPTEYMYVARLIANDADPNDSSSLIEDQYWRSDPNLPDELHSWAKSKPKSSFEEITSSLRIFSDREIARKVHLMYALNIISTILGGFFNRNERTIALLEDYKDNFPDKDRIYDLISCSLKTITQLQLEKDSFWSAKANFFSLIVAIAKRLEAKNSIDISATREALIKFAAKPDEAYSLAAREAVNNKKERQTRDRNISALLK